MVTKLKASFLYTEIENNVIIVGFADDEFDTQEYILLQKAMEYDEQDKSLVLIKYTLHTAISLNLRMVGF